MARFSSAYKQISPTRRIIQGENSYEKGMYWTNSVVAQGYVHTILNYELDQLNYTVRTTGGLHTTDIASGCSFLDRAIFGSGDADIIVLQPRNEYNLRAFEGITNIISANKITIKNNQTLEEKLRQQGFTADDVICYKLLTYNPFNHRLMSITLVQAKRDKYFVIDNEYNLRRLNSNPISCGFSEVWNNNYVSNKLDYHLNGKTDNYIPRTKRNSYNETFGQKLHSTAYMQTVPNCEGYGNKTFCFTKKKQIELEGPIKNTTIVNTRLITKVVSNNFGGPGRAGKGYEVDDIIEITVPGRTITPHRVKVTNVVPVGFTGFVKGVSNVRVLTWGIFEGSPDTFSKMSTQTRVFRNNTLTEITEPVVWSLSLTEDKILTTEENKEITTQDIYLKNINIGSSIKYDATIAGLPVPLDAFRYGIVLTSCALVKKEHAISEGSIQAINDKHIWDTALVNEIQHSNELPLFKLNLTNGCLEPTDSCIEASVKPTIAFKALPYINRNIADQPTSNFDPSSVFEVIEIPNWGNSLEAIHPSSWLKQSIKDTLRIGQGFRFAVHCITNKNPARYLNIIKENPLNSIYYTQEVEAVFVLDYVWNGFTWEFSFIDTSVATTNDDSLVENWETDAMDALGNRITRHYIWTNSLAYTDVLTENNITNMAQHILDSYNATKMVYSKTTNKLHRGYSQSLQQNLDETIDDSFPDSLGLINKSKLNDISYAHFEIKPKTLTPGEAVLWGYNMLSNNPYTFECIYTPGTQIVSITGAILKNANNTNEVLLKPVINTPGVLEIYHQGDYSYLAEVPIEKQTLQLQIEYKNPSDDWRKLKDYSISETYDALSVSKPIQIAFTGADETTMIRITLRDTDPEKAITIPSVTGSGKETIYLVVSQIITTLSYTKNANKTEPSPKTFDLGSAVGMTYWKGRLVLWGILDAENMLFMSEPNAPDYFAYPNGADILEENIVHVLPYSDALIVFTSTKLWRIDLNADGLSWTKSLLQQNLRITNSDIPYITVLKNMLFFKSGNQFYMLVPSKTSTVGELAIAPISKPITDLLKNPFAAIREVVRTIYPDLAGKEALGTIINTTDPEGNIIDIPNKPITDYLVKYGVHTEQNKVIIDWWFDMSDWKNQTEHYSDSTIQHDVVIPTNPKDSATLLNKEYWLFQLIYDTETYSWSMRTHTSSSIGVFITDAVNPDTDFISLVFNPEETLFEGSAKATWGVAISHRKQPADYTIQEFNLSEFSKIKILKSTYPRFQVFDTGYKEVSSPSLKKRFREIQLNFEPDPETEEGLRSAFIASIDGNTVMSAVSQEIFEETISDPITGNSTIIKVVDKINLHNDALLDPNTPVNYVPLPYIVDGKLSNTFVLDNSALTGVKHVKIRRQINGKGYLVRLRFVNITHAKYSLTNYAFAYHNKNSR